MLLSKTGFDLYEIFAVHHEPTLESSGNGMFRWIRQGRKKKGAAMSLFNVLFEERRASSLQAVLCQFQRVRFVRGFQVAQ